MTDPANDVLTHLVVDTGALIRLEQLHDKALKFWTIQEVLTEVRDAKSREALKRLPFELQVREPTNEAIAAVVSFAKKTGDIGVLSKPDIKVMALAFMLHKETHGTKGLRDEPGQIMFDDEDDETTTNYISEEEEENDVIDVATLGLKKEGISWAAALGAPSEPTNSSNKWDDDDFINGSNEETIPIDEDFPSLSSVVACTKSETDRFLSTKATIAEEIRQNEAKQKKKVERLEKKLAQKVVAIEMVDELEQVDIHDTKPTPIMMNTRIIGGVVDDKVDEDDDDNWISSNNIDIVDTQVALRKLGLVSQEENPKMNDIKVACVTTDFAMQNVMLQMKMRLMSLDGRSITHIRRFHLKCDSCKEICKQLEKIFCPSCGNNTLARLSYSISPLGVLRYHYKKNRVVSTRGKKYCIPKPAGGRTGDLLLNEDQLLTGWWGQQARKKTTATCIFGEHISESVGVQMNSRGDAIRVGYGRQNPNAAKGRERRGKKVKRSSKKPGHL